MRDFMIWKIKRELARCLTDSGYAGYWHELLTVRKHKEKITSTRCYWLSQYVDEYIMPERFVTM